MVSFIHMKKQSVLTTVLVSRSNVDWDILSETVHSNHWTNTIIFRERGKFNKTSELNKEIESTNVEDAKVKATRMTI